MSHSPPTSSSSRLPAPIPVAPSHPRSRSNASLSSSPSGCSINSITEATSSIISLHSSSPSISSSSSSSLISSLFSVFPLSFSPPLSSSTASPSLSGTEFHYHSSGVEDDFELIDQQRGLDDESSSDADDDQLEQQVHLDTRDMFIDHDYDRTKLEGKLSLSWLEQEARECKPRHSRGGSNRSPRSPPLMAEQPTCIPNCQPIQIPSSASFSPHKTSSSLFSRSLFSSSAPSDPTPLFTSLLNKKAQSNSSQTNMSDSPTPSSAISAPVQIAVGNKSSSVRGSLLSLSSSPASPPTSSGPLFTTKHVNNKKKNKKARAFGVQSQLQLLPQPQLPTSGMDGSIYCVQGSSATGDLMLLENEKKAKQNKKSGKVKAF